MKVLLHSSNATGVQTQFGSKITSQRGQTESQIIQGSVRQATLQLLAVHISGLPNPEQPTPSMHLLHAVSAAPRHWEQCIKALSPDKGSAARTAHLPIIAACTGTASGSLQLDVHCNARAHSRKTLDSRVFIVVSQRRPDQPLTSCLHLMSASQHMPACQFCVETIGKTCCTRSFTMCSHTMQGAA